MSIFILRFRQLFFISLFSVLFAGINPKQCLAFSIQLDQATGNFIVTYISEDSGREVRVIFEPPVKVAPKASLRISLDTANFVYSYSIENSSSARQYLDEFDLPISTQPQNVVSPPDWSSLSPIFPQSPLLTWGAKVAGIRPGSELAGFLVKTPFIPGIGTLRFAGLAQPLAFPDEPPEDVEASVLNLQRQDTNTFIGITGVMPSTFSFTNISSTVDRLISLKHQSVSLGWIFGPGVDGIVNSLDSKLSAAKDSVSRGADTAAANQLNAFINELDAHRGKHLNDNAYFLLKANAQFIISKLGVPK